MYKKILIATDGSKNSERAVQHGIKLAKPLNAEVIGTYIIDISAFLTLPETVVWDNVKDLLHKEGEKAAEFIKKEAEKEGVRVKTIVKEGSPSKDIVEIAEKENADVIIVGTAGRTGLDRFLLGSISEKVVRTAKCPVIVIK